MVPLYPPLPTPSAQIWQIHSCNAIFRTEKVGLAQGRAGAWRGLSPRAGMSREDDAPQASGQSQDLQGKAPPGQSSHPSMTLSYLFITFLGCGSRTSPQEPGWHQLVYVGQVSDLGLSRGEAAE